MCDDFRQQLFSNGCVQCAASSFTCAVSFDSDRVMTSTSIFGSTWNPLSHAQGTYRQNCVIELQKNQISELHLDKFPDTSDFQCRITNFLTEVCSCSGYPTHAMLWIKEVEVAKSVDHLVTSQSIGGYVLQNFSDASCEDCVCVEEDHL